MEVGPRGPRSDQGPASSLHWAAVSSDVIYTMYRADKFYGPDRQVLQNISLSFLHGAKIGVLGPNGAGKSTLLRIMAGLEEPSSGVAELDPKATVGLLPQEPELDPAKDVRGNVEDGVRELRDLLDRFDGDLRGLRRARRRLRRALGGAGLGPGADRPARRLEPRRDARPRDGRAPPAGGRPRRDDPLRRRAPAGRALSAPALVPGSAAPRRADEPPRRRVGRMAGAPSRELPRHRDRGHPRPLLPRQRGRLDPRARPRPRASRSRATTPRGSSRSRRGSRPRRSRTPRGAVRSRASSSGCG